MCVCVCVFVYFLNLTNNSQDKSQDIKENYGFKTNTPPHIKEWDNFEAELISLVRLIKYRRINNNIRQKIKDDLTKVENSNKIRVKADKSSNVYKISPNK